MKKPRPEILVLRGKKTNWIQPPKDGISYYHLQRLTKDAPELVALEALINALGEYIIVRLEKLVIFSRSPVIVYILALVSLQLPTYSSTKDWYSNTYLVA